jgi:hypothetical protein
MFDVRQVKTHLCADPENQGIPGISDTACTGEGATCTLYNGAVNGVCEVNGDCCYDTYSSSKCYDYVVTDPCTGDVLQMGPGGTKAAYEGSTDASVRKWAGLTCAWEDDDQTDQIVQYLRLDNTNITCDLNGTGEFVIMWMVWRAEAARDRGDVLPGRRFFRSIGTSGTDVPQGTTS